MALDMRPLSKKQFRDQQWARQGGKCFYCGRDMIRQAGAPRKGDINNRRLATLDHIVPKSRGGGGGINLVWACHQCNNKKGNNPPDDRALAYVAERQREERARYEEYIIVQRALANRKLLSQAV